MRKKIKLLNVSVAILSALPMLALSDLKESDTHYSEQGFFDIHYCNWPDRANFLMGIYSTVFFKNLETVEIITPDKKTLVFLDLTKSRQFKTKNNKLKKAFINQIARPDNMVDGWYIAKIKYKNQDPFILKDYVKHTPMPLVDGFLPPNHAEKIKVPHRLSWESIQQAKFYQVFIRDIWQENKLVFQSKLLQTNEVQLPKGIIQAGGSYTWKVHARDINGDIVLGDFNHGSVSASQAFSVAE